LVKVGHPPVAYLACDKVAEFGVGLVEPAALGNPVCLVVKLLRPHLVKILDKPGAQKFRVQRAHAVNRMARDDGKIRHAHLLVVSLLNERHAAQAVEVAGELVGHLAQKVGVDIINNLHVARQQVRHEPHRPLLKRLGHERVVRVGESLLRDIPRLVPGQPVLVNKQPHELRDSNSRMSVVKLYRHLVRKRLEVSV